LTLKSQEIKMLRHRLGNKRIVPSPDERRELLARGAKLDHQVDGLIEIVAPETYRQWLRDAARGKEPRKVGRKPSEGELVTLVLEMRKNPGWGLQQIVGELRKLGITTNHMTVKAILERHSTEPNPDGSSTRKKPIIPWNQFIQMHLDSLLACDFFQKTIRTWRGAIIAFALVFIHYGSRRVFVSPSTYNPHILWLEQQVRNLAMWLEDEGIQAKYLIRDNDVKSNGPFDGTLKRIGIKTVKRSIAAPDMSPVVESWIGRCQAECLDYFVCISLRQLDRINQTYARFYNEYRPSQSRVIGNLVLSKSGQPTGAGAVKCQTWLGGLLRHYYREGG